MVFAHVLMFGSLFNCQVLDHKELSGKDAEEAIAIAPDSVSPWLHQSY